MNKKEHPEIQWLDSVSFPQKNADIQFTSPVRERAVEELAAVVPQRRYAKRTHSRKWCFACMVTGGIIFALISALATASQATANELADVGANPKKRVAWVTPEKDKPASNATVGMNAANEQAAVNAAKSLSQVFRLVSKRVLPTVVAVENNMSVEKRDFVIPSNSAQGGTSGPAFSGNGVGPGPTPSAPGWSMPGAMGVGSGVIIDPAGLILTNNHVVRGDGEITIRLQDGREFIANKVFTDPKTDIAVVKVSPDKPLPAAIIGDSDQAQVGDWVLALGQPFGLESTVTAGIISAKSRAMGITDREDFIQTDAAINPGNSGGPLVNLDGHVVGINTAISSRGGGNDGVGFAVPVNLAKWVADELIDDGVVQRAYLGVGIKAINQQIADRLNIEPRCGLLVTNIVNGSPADVAGMREGDVVLEFANQAVRSPSRLQTLVERSKIGTRHNVKLLRQGQTIEVSYLAGKSEMAKTEDALNAEANSPIAYEQLGLVIDNLNADVANDLRIKGVRGVVIMGVRGGSPAERAGLKPGMVIQQVNRVPIASQDGFQQQLMKSNPRAGIGLLVYSSAGSGYTVLRP